MANQPLAYCDGPHAGPCPNRVIRLLRELAEQGATSSLVRSAADVFRQIVDLGRGGEDLSCGAQEDKDCPYGADKPYFDEELGELWARGLRLHCFGAQACNEVAILKKLQANHWRHKVFNPLGNGTSKKYGASLKTTICRINQCQDLWLIEFHSHPDDRAVSWKWRLP